MVYNCFFASGNAGFYVGDAFGFSFSYSVKALAAYLFGKLFFPVWNVSVGFVNFGSDFLLHVSSAKDCSAFDLWYKEGGPKFFRLSEK